MKEKIKKNKLLYNILLWFKHFILFLYYGMFMKFFKLFPIKKNKIVISNYYGRGYGDNAKYICDSLLSKNITNVDIVWLCNDINDFSIPDGIRKVKYGSIKSLYELSTAKVWLDNCRKPYYIKKRKGQYYIQLWHGNLFLKRLEFDVSKELGKYYTKNMIKDNKIADLFISNSKFFTNKCRETFKYNGEILERGEPKNDVLMKNYIKLNTEFRNKYGYKDKTIILYAPTFRNNYAGNPYNIDFERLYDTYSQLGHDVIIFVRLHPNIKYDMLNLDYNDHIVNMSNYPDMQDLLAVADILITDYSSTMFEFMLLNKQVILYANDIDLYVKERGFYFDLKDLPFSLSTNNDELCKNIVDKFDPSKYKKLQEEIGHFGYYDSAEKIADRIIEVIGAKEKNE